MPKAAARKPDRFRAAVRHAGRGWRPEGSYGPPRMGHRALLPGEHLVLAVPMTHEHARTGPIRSEYTVGDTTVLELRGDLDIAVTPVVTARLDALAACPHPDLVVDLRPVPFLDCAALGALCRARARVRKRHGRLRLVSGSDRLRDIMRRTGLADTFEIHRSLTDVLSFQPREYRRVVPAFADRPSEGFSRSR